MSETFTSRCRSVEVSLWTVSRRTHRARCEARFGATTIKYTHPRALSGQTLALLSPMSGHSNRWASMRPQRSLLRPPATR